ncbi:MAG: SOS response-associated peptidase [Alphaproteobacteria bacterium]|nr:SOS response-associated peptidase [Alphaproteobacteria bacterium]
MCGRYLITTPVEGLRAVFGFRNPAPNLPPRYNVAPTQRVPVIRRAAGARAIDLLRWGLVPSWAKDLSVGSRMINARGESVAEKPAYRAAFRARRCLVPADGFYEWQTVGQNPPKHPFLFRMRDGRPFAFAGLWERWQSPEREIVETFTIVNTAATGMMTDYHDRVPIVLAPADYDAWLDASVDPMPLIQAPPGDWFAVTPVSAYVNDVRHDDPGCLAPPANDEPAAKPAKRPRDVRQGSLF